MTVAMAIGANSAVFSVMNGLILRPLDVPQAQSLYGIERASDKDASQSYPDYLDLRDRNQSFDGLAAYTISEVALDTGTPEAHIITLYEPSSAEFEPDWRTRRPR